MPLDCRGFPRWHGGGPLLEANIQWLPLLAALLGAGAAGGLLAGLLGVGGGIVIVPALDLALTLAGVEPAVALHVAVATSMATIVPTSISSSRSHARRGAIDGAVVRRWSLPIVVGAFAGSLFASSVDARVLSGVFGVVALLAALKMVLPLDGVVLRQGLPAGLGGASIPASIGAISAMMGIGGGTLTVPAMTLCGEPVHKAVGTAALLGLWISVPGDHRLPAGGYDGRIGAVVDRGSREPRRLCDHRAGGVARGAARRAPGPQPRPAQAVRGVRRVPAGRRRTDAVPVVRLTVCRCACGSSPTALQPDATVPPPPGRLRAWPAARRIAGARRGCRSCAARRASWRDVHVAPRAASPARCGSRRRRCPRSLGLTSNAPASSSAAPASVDSTSTPGSSGSWAATYSLATRFMPSRIGVTTPTPAQRRKPINTSCEKLRLR